jgi:hypothetical protein
MTSLDYNPELRIDGPRHALQPRGRATAFPVRPRGLFIAHRPSVAPSARGRLIGVLIETPPDGITDY